MVLKLYRVKVPFFYKLFLIVAFLIGGGIYIAYDKLLLGLFFVPALLYSFSYFLGVISVHENYIVVNRLFKVFWENISEIRKVDQKRYIIIINKFPFRLVLRETNNFEELISKVKRKNES